MEKLHSKLESIRLGHTRCDFLRPEDFFELCKQWLRSDRFHHVVTLNPEMVMLAETDMDFRGALQGADIRVPDGSGLIWARWYLRSHFWALWPSLMAFSFREVQRVTGVDAVIELGKLAEGDNLPVYLLGGTAQQAKKTAALLTRMFPRLQVATSPDHTFDMIGPEAVVSHIKEVQPAVLLVAYGAPKQTLWIERHRQTLPSVRVAVGVGGAFAILSEEKPRAPRILRRMNAEWLWRLWLEPSRLPRIWNAVVRFPLLVDRQKPK